MAVDLTKFTKGRSFKPADFNFNDATDLIEIKTDATSAVGIAIAAGGGGTPSGTSIASAITGDAAAQASIAASLVDDLGATAAETIAGAIDNKLISPADLHAAFVSSKTTDGYVKLPGGLIIQWGRRNVAAGAGQAFSTPIPFPTAVFTLVAAHWGAKGDVNAVGNMPSNSQVYLSHTHSDATAVSYIAIGH
jgi:hypothetical protein